MILTKPQRRALKALFDRGPIWETIASAASGCPPMSYRRFRRRVQPEFGGSAILIHWCGIWVGIEPNGYTHS
jgi:hypothetical protein